MKITPETKIKDLFCGFNLDIADEDDKYVLNLSDKTITIYIKSKDQKKNFDIYLHEYLNKTGLELSPIYKGRIKELILVHHNYRLVPFEIKIGLLEYIIQQTKTGDYSTLSQLSFFLRDLLEGKEFSNLRTSDITDKLIEICPKRFLKSIFE